MGSQDTHRRPDLFGALEAQRQERQKAADEAVRPERERIEKQAAADAKLMGTAAWDALGDFRKARATQYATRPAQGQTAGGGNDAA
ncbi:MULTISPECIES: hypothetical protein [unclassified Streptomyces]|uniref:hypothetical protein n=1 Tax=unclassified Streptomyces TaxID=2593676 RepID=UPI00340E19FE